MKSIKKDLILGIVENYSFDRTRLFLSSLKRTGFDGDVCFFVSGLSPIARSALKHFGVRCIPFTGTYPYIKGFSIPEAGAFHPHFRHLHLFVVRYLIYYFYLTHVKDVYGRVLLSDVKDVIFQKRPFDFGWEADTLYSFLENSRIPIGESSVNVRWVSTLFGEEGLRQVADKPVICAGVTMGDTSALLRHMERILRCIKELPTYAALAQNIDQGLHEFLIYTQDDGRIRLMTSENGPVLHLVSVPDHEICFDRDKRFINVSGQVPCVVHHYDRHPRSLEAVLMTFASSDVRLNPVAKLLDEVYTIAYWFLRGCPHAGSVKSFVRHIFSRILRNVKLFVVKRIRKARSEGNNA